MARLAWIQTRTRHRSAHPSVDDKTIQAILRHSNIGITQNIYIKSVTELQVSAMDTLSEKFDLCNVRATSDDGRVN